MRRVTPFLRQVLCSLAILLTISILPCNVNAQEGQGILTRRAVLPAETLAEGPKSGEALAPKQKINGVIVPFGSQPVGNFAAIVPGDYADAWYALSDGNFDTPQNSADYLLRIYTVQIDWRTVEGGAGTATAVDWITLNDSRNKIAKALANPSSKRELTGADFTPYAMRRTADHTFWIAESNGPSLIHVDSKGAVIDAPFALQGAGALQGLALLPDGKTLVVAQRASNNNNLVLLRLFNTTNKTVGDTFGTIPVQSSHNLTGFSMINATQMLIIEQDNRENAAAQFKQILLADLSSNPAQVTSLVNLLNLTDPSKISTAQVFNSAPDAFGIGGAFKFPFAVVSGVYPLDEQTIVVVNNNNIPFGQGRSKSKADDTEFIAVQVSQAFKLDQAFAVPR